MKNNKENSYLINENIELNKINSSNNASINNEITLIFRNQLSSDTILKFNKSKLPTLKISDIVELLFSKLNISKSESNIRLFFKGRPLKQEEHIRDLCKQIINLRIYNIIIYKL